MANPIALGIIGIVREFFKGRKNVKLGEQDIQALLIQLDTKIASGQLEVNKIEAMHRSWFVAGWRPSLGWVCALALASQYVINPYLVQFGFHPVDIETGPIIVLVSGMLGLNLTRTFEKFKGLTK